MDTEKTNTQTEAESLNSSTQTPATAVTDEEKDFINGIIYSLYEEAIDELDKQTEAERAEFSTRVNIKNVLHMQHRHPVTNPFPSKEEGKTMLWTECPASAENQR